MTNKNAPNRDRIRYLVIGLSFLALTAGLVAGYWLISAGAEELAKAFVNFHLAVTQNAVPPIFWPGN